MLTKPFLAIALAATALAANALEPAIKKLPSGVTIETVVEGAGVSPVRTDAVAVNYRGTLLDGTEFDKNDARFPVRFPLQQVIPCWTEAIPHMKLGGRSIITCPAHTAYGDRAVGKVIKPGSTLRFEVDLIAVN